VSARWHDVVAQGSQYGIAVTRFSEWAGDGRPGAKQRFRDHAVAEFGGRADVPTLRRLFAPGLTGTANAVFAAYRGRDLIWLEQDAQPVALERPGGDLYEWGVRLHGDAARFETATYHDTASGSIGIRRHEVDVPHIIDRLLYAPELEATPMSRQLPSYEDAGFELFTGVPPSMSLRRWTSAFGTVVGLSGRTRAQPLTMWDTRIRLVDFAVGQLAQGRGVAGCVAGTSLEHHRGDVTDSGRGELTSYLETEELLWPLLAAAQSALDRVGPEGDYADWLERAADSLTVASSATVVPAGLAYARWAELRHDIDVARASPLRDVRAYGDALAAGLPAPYRGHWFDSYKSVNRSAKSELLRYASQLRTWACVASAPEHMSGAEDMSGG